MVNMDFAAVCAKFVNAEDVGEQRHLVERLKEHHKIDYPYGGWLENRSNLWNNKYMMKENPPRPIHLGIDYWVPAGTAVNIPWTGETIHAVHDKDQDGGWGGRVTFYNHAEDFYFILGHLAPNTDLHTPGVHFYRGCTVGFIGKPEENGGWSPHLHLQVVSTAEFEKFRDDPMKIDGYAAMTDDLSERYPNPSRYAPGARLLNMIAGL